jgi:hypothetical protein
MTIPPSLTLGRCTFVAGMVVASLGLSPIPAVLGFLACAAESALAYLETRRPTDDLAARLDALTVRLVTVENRTRPPGSR